MKKLIEKLAIWYLTRRHYQIYQPTDNTPTFVREMRGAK